MLPVSYSPASYSQQPNQSVLSVGGTEIILHKDSRFTNLGTDFIVNPANPSLQGGGGLDKQIHDEAGPDVKRACKKLLSDSKEKECPNGETRITHAGCLPHVAILHTVGPKVHKGQNLTPVHTQQLWDAYHRSLQTADDYCNYVLGQANKGQWWLKYVGSKHEHALKGRLTAGQKASITLPCISTGAYHFPVDRGANICVRACVDYVNNRPFSHIRHIHLSCCRDQKDIPFLEQEMQKVAGVAHSAIVPASPATTPLCSSCGGACDSVSRKRPAPLDSEEEELASLRTIIELKKNEGSNTSALEREYEERRSASDAKRYRR